MRAFSRYALSAVFAGVLGLSALTAPAAARADDDEDAIVEVLVALTDIYFNGGQPYYRPTREPLYVDYDYGEPRYYRHVPRYRYYAPRSRYAYAPYPVREMKCDRYGRCKVKYHRDRDRDWDDDDGDDDRRRWRHRHRDWDDDD